MYFKFGVWIGAFLVNNTFKWLDGSQINYTNWHKDQPRNYNSSEFCVAMSLSETQFGKWYDVFCTDSYLVLCQKSLNYKQNNSDLFMPLSESNFISIKQSLSHLINLEIILICVLVMILLIIMTGIIIKMIC